MVEHTKYCKSIFFMFRLYISNVSAFSSPFEWFECMLLSHQETCSPGLGFVRSRRLLIGGNGTVTCLLAFLFVQSAILDEYAKYRTETCWQGKAQQAAYLAIWYSRMRTEETYASERVRCCYLRSVFRKKKVSTRSSTAAGTAAAQAAAATAMAEGVAAIVIAALHTEPQPGQCTFISSITPLKIATSTAAV